MPHPGDSSPDDWPTVMSGALRRCARALTGSDEQAEELTQQTLATLLARAPDKAMHFGYARTTLFRLWLDRQRSWRRHLRSLGRLARGADLGRRERGAEEQASLDEQSSRLARAVAALPPRQRAVLVLRLVEELGYEQIAEALGCTVGSVRSSLHLARARLRRQLGEGDAP